MYLQNQDPHTFQEVAQSSSSEVTEILGYNIRQLVGNLPPDQFGVQVVTSREGLAKMLSGAMMSGYFLRAMEQRMQLEKALHPAEIKSSASTTADESDLSES
jgi:hypothetical protein